LAIFSRRSLQRMLSANAEWLSSKDAADQRNALNNLTPAKLGDEWEAAVLYGLSRLGSVQHHDKLKGPRPVDIRFSAGQEPDTLFIADVTAVSDRGLADQNPVDYLKDEIIGLAKKTTVRINSLRLTVGSERVRGNKMRAKLPPKGQIPRLARQLAAPLLKAALREPRGLHSTELSSPTTNATLSYDPVQQFFTMHGVGYAYPWSKSKNPLRAALDEKSRQLKSTGYEGTKGIVLCDGGCYAMHEPRFVTEIVSYFLQTTTTVAFVAALTIVVPENPPTPWEVRCMFFTRRLDEGQMAAIANVFSKLVKELPTPAEDPINAINRLGEKYGQLRPPLRPPFVGWGMSNTEARVSLRRFHEFLAGRRTVDELCADPRWAPEHARRYFERQLASGNLMTNVWIERGQEQQDDDWLVFEFGASDPAVGDLNITR
jgi:hypothetical protein